ncbi:NAD(P)H-hydrate dehydratase [Paludibacterium purpuratum]|uniref:Bifunctional NAD(P)H-hydrate repair enzyme n=1 Tax=Paludibacterium purpuratum TaxID=1144873 RepID=A0A4R7BD78_9NEIS|nr:NAD(P)H-hydrate dehydratase [Paludibacterium purpuratum]TDR81597.1 hydroxyethylthiazole kinase-like uncharacterized protein yjeF/hydroxyethylthiazole kinase-like uncharacterized protein yjeF [Paludibacterium purpuratum]
MSAAIYSQAALRALEQRADALGVDLMARAGQAAADWIAARWATGARILLAAGPGNNGGDALVVADLLARGGFRVDVLQPRAPQTPAARQALARWQAAGGTVRTMLAPHEPRPDLLVDGLFGIGISRPFDNDWCALIHQLNALGAPVLALDVPTGLDAWRGTALNAVLRADATLTFLCHKPGLFTGEGPDLAGQVQLDTLQHPGWAGEAPEGAVYHPAGLDKLSRAHNSHKGSYGCVGIVGGSEGMLGAALLAGRAALAGGAGKVLIAALDPRLPVDPQAPALMIRAADALPICDVLALGPGMGREGAAQALLDAAIDQPLPLVLDADALNLLAAEPSWQTRIAERRAPTVLTPHPAEAARLLACHTAEIQADRLEAARRLAERLNAVTVLKGAGSLIVGPDRYYHVNRSGGPALASAGQGDVLSGLIAALLAQHMEPFAAASLAVHVHGLAGDAYTASHGGPIGLSADATVVALSAELNRLVASANRRTGMYARS